MTTTRRVRAGAIDTSTLETPIRMVAGEVEQKPMPIEFVGDEPDDSDCDSVDTTIIGLAVVLFIVALILAIASLP